MSVHCTVYIHFRDEHAFIVVTSTVCVYAMNVGRLFIVFSCVEEEGV